MRQCRRYPIFLPLRLPHGFLYAALRYPIRFGVLEIFGDVSYSWYLLHAIVGYRLMEVTAALGRDKWLAAIFGIAAFFALSIATYLAIERPTINLGKNLIRRHRFGKFISAPT